MNKIPIKDERFLKALLDYCEGLNPTGLSRNPYEARYRVFSYLVCATEKNALPCVMNNTAYKAFRGQTFYRGTLDSEFHAQLLCDYDYHYGIGFGMNGIYASASPRIATLYSDNHIDPNTLIEFKLSPAARIASSELSYDLLKERLLIGEEPPGTREILFFLSQHKQSNGGKLLLDAVKRDSSVLALLLGYDALIDDPINHSDDYSIVILNRGMMVVSESTLKDVTKQSPVYRGGVIDHEEKRKRGYLDE